MNLVSKLSQKTVFQKIMSTDWDTFKTSPFVVELDPTTACNLACPGCISGDLLNQKGPNSRFSDNRLIQIGHELVEFGVKAVILIGGGEPLSHPGIGKLIRYFFENDVKIGITTNGTFIKKYLELIAETVSWTRVSMDAGTDPTFKQLRPTAGGASKFFEIIDSMRNLGKIKKGLLGYSFLIRTKKDGNIENPAGRDDWGVVNISNIEEIFGAAKLAKELGCDYFEPKPSYDDNHNLITHSHGDIETLKAQLKLAKTLEDENFKILESINLNAALNEERLGDQPKSYTMCPAAQLRTLITPSGVYVCPYFRGHNPMKIGDLKNSTFKELWTGEHREAVMKKLNPKETCANLHCIRHETNNQVFQILNNQSAPSLIEETDRFI